MNARESVDLARIVAHPRSAYYIVAPSYVRTSAGIKALHFLCHALNRIGERAYMVIEPYPSYFSPTHPDLLTPLLTHDVISADFERGITPIVVYPETISGNALRAPCVVRYVMNFPGLLGGDIRFGSDELCFGYSSALAQAVGAPDNVLFIPASDIDLFTPEPRVPRRGTCFFAGKYRDFHGGKLLPITADSVEITRDRPDSLTPAEIAELFRRSELLYCYENSALAIEAVLCECPVVFLPNRYLTRVIAEKELGLDGYAWGADQAEIARAKATVVQGRLNYLRSYRTFWEQLERFVAVTQIKAKSKPYERAIHSHSVNQPTATHELQTLARTALFVYRQHGWLGVGRKAIKRLVRMVLRTPGPTKPRW